VRETAIAVDELTRDYGTLRAVDHISFTVAPGEIFGFLGPNGAGKTTTLRMLTTILSPTSGRALIHGYDVQRHSYDARLHFGVVPEESNIFSELSAWDNLMFSARLYQVPRGQSEQRAEQLLRLFDLWERRQVKTQFFSRGMRRKVTIAMSLIHTPSVLFLDEPTSGLDVQSTRAIHELVRSLNRDGMTIFLTTHRMEEANALCHRIAIINHARIAAIDTPANLRATMQQVQSVEVQLEGLAPEDVQALGSLPSVARSLSHGTMLRLYTAEPVATIRHVLAYADERGKDVTALDSVGPSLEDVFLYLTGGADAIGTEAPAAPEAARQPRGGGR